MLLFCLTVLDLPFKAHRPVKTSSPIEGNGVMNGGNEVDNKKDRVVSPILFLCEDDDREEPKSEPLPTQKCNRCVIKRNVFCQFICNKKVVVLENFLK